MIYEYTARVLNQPLVMQKIKHLGEQEKIIENSRRSDQRERRRQAEREADRIRGELLSDADPTAVFHFLDTTKLANADLFRNKWQQESIRIDYIQASKWTGISEAIGEFYSPPSFDLSAFPVGSFAVQFKFALTTPYISKDDNDFYIIDNPIVKDKALKLPMMRSTSWKGSLLAAVRQLDSSNLPERISRIFGEASEEEEKGHAGRLYFYPSFYTQSNLEIINPHDRKKKIGRNPILIESVGQNAEGKDAEAFFSLLYAPLDRVGEDEVENQTQAFRDLELIARGLKELFTVYGFGAKTSSNFGVASDRMPKGLPGELILQLKGGPQGWAKEKFVSLTYLVRLAEALERASQNRGGS